MEYLKNNSQRIERKLYHNIIINLIKKKHHVQSHFELFLKYFLDMLYPTHSYREKLSILEIGGGDGWALSYKNKRIKRKVMIDCDDTYKKKLVSEGVEFYKLELGKDNIQFKGVFDLIILNHVIEHVADYNKAITQLHQFIKPKGYVLVRCPNVLVNKHAFWNDFTHVKPYTPSSLEKAFQSYGFKKILLSKFSYNRFMLGFLFHKSIQKKLYQIKGDEILYIGQKI
jgi:2-polyprenyl-3-methyl-5-hydroxy-6-metoxy-1,4-benzoquinol methylase